MAEALSTGIVMAAPSPERSAGSFYHLADITPAEAVEINSHINIVAYGIVHGVPSLGEGDPRQVEKAYQAADDIVGSLDPARGDAFFLESIFHDGTFWLDSYPLSSIDEQFALLQRERSNRTVNPLAYAADLAWLKGVPVIPADMHRQVAEQFEDIIGDVIPERPDPAWPAHGAYHTLRVEQAANTVKDYARNALPSLGDEKPTYALAMGPAHVDQKLAYVSGIESITYAFGRLGLNVETAMLPSAYDTPEQSAVQAFTEQVAAYTGALALGHQQ